MKYTCSRCKKEREREDFDKIDEGSLTGVCFYCELPKVNMRSIERRLIMGSSEQKAEAERTLKNFNKYANSPERNINIQSLSDDVKKWYDIENLCSYFQNREIILRLKYDEVKEIFWQFFRNIVQTQNQDYSTVTIEEEQKDQFINFIKWLIKDESGVYNINKSILIYGRKGTGKSTLVEAGAKTMTYIADKTPFKNKFGIVEMDMLIHNLHTTGNLKPLEKMKDGFLCIDEITEEHQVYKNFGNEIRLIEDILRVRHLNWKKKGQLTILTTNLSPKSFTDLFNSRTQDRIIQEYEVMEMKGNINYRQLNSKK